MTALMLASQRGHTGIVRMLIQKGAYVNMKTVRATVCSVDEL